MCACGARVTVVFLCVVFVHSALSVTHATNKHAVTWLLFKLSMGMNVLCKTLIYQHI